MVEGLSLSVFLTKTHICILEVPPASFTSVSQELHTAMFSTVVLSVFIFLKPKCLHMLALPLSFLTTINSSSSRAAIFMRERDREREFCPLSGFRYTSTLRPVPVYRTEATRIGDSVLPPHTASSIVRSKKTVSN